MNKLNKQIVLEKLQKFVLKQIDIKDLKLDLTGATTQMQNSKRGEVVFYRLRDDLKSRDDFEKRRQGRGIDLLILSGKPNGLFLENTLIVSDENFLAVQKEVCDLFYPNKNLMKLVGVTGTNGKTTTVNLAMQVSETLGNSALSLGTMGLSDAKGRLLLDLESTTPSYVELRKIIFQYQDEYSALFMEVSSHALVQDRLGDLRLDQTAWTSFSQDHLDYHKTMDEYFSAKMLIAKKFLKTSGCLIVPKREVELIKRISGQFRSTEAKTLAQRGYTQLPLFYHSSYNQSNMELALELNEKLWKRSLPADLDLNKIKTPSGRFSIFEVGKNKLAIVDYAHTPDALINIGQAIKSAFPQFHQTVIFGCGGNRDKKKRPLMGSAVESFAHKIVVTTDNPRDEKPEDIAQDIIQGIKQEVEVCLDRKEAILGSLRKMQEYEVVLIAGKGHESYQEIKGVKHPFSDIGLVLEFISAI